jgi:hypothetical protein
VIEVVFFVGIEYVCNFQTGHELSVKRTTWLYLNPIQSICHEVETIVVRGAVFIVALYCPVVLEYKTVVYRKIH